MKDFEILKIIGNGTFGKVFKVKYLLDNNQLKYDEIKILKKMFSSFYNKITFFISNSFKFIFNNRLLFKRRFKFTFPNKKN